MTRAPPRPICPTRRITPRFSGASECITWRMVHRLTRSCSCTGQPTWSWLRRNVMPRLEGRGRLIAVDLIGYGLSDKPDLDYGIEDHIRYLDAFIDTLGPGPITLVTHDWGSFLGFHYAHRFPERIKGPAFMEALLDPVPGHDAFDPATRDFFQTLRASQANAERMMIEENQQEGHDPPARRERIVSGGGGRGRHLRRCSGMRGLCTPASGWKKG